MYTHMNLFIYQGNSGCSGSHHRKWTQQPEFKSWIRLFAFHTALIGKSMNPTILPSAMGNSRTDGTF